VQKRRKRVSKQDWLEKGLEVLERDGVAGVRVEGMARELGVAKSGFYWHFQDRDDLLHQMLGYWAHEYTEVATRNPELLHATPEERLRLTMHMILELDLGGLDVSLRAWAKRDPEVARVVRRVYAMRSEFIGGAFAELGFTGEDLEMRTRLFVVYHSWERTAFWKDSKKELRSLIDRRLGLLLRK
jgi:AcrR family transcriptional regulator